MMMMSVASSNLPTAAPSASSVAGWIAIFQEDDAELKEQALQQLLLSVDYAWHEIAEILPDLEALAEEENHATAAALASRVLFHLQEPVAALRIAVTCQQLFLLNDDSPYATALTQTALDAYIGLRQDKETEGLSIEQLQPMVNNFLKVACDNHKYQEAVGIALEARLPEQLKSILETANNDIGLLQYTLRHIQTTSKTFRKVAAKVVCEQLEQGQQKSYYDLVWVYQFLQQPSKVAELLTNVDKLTSLQLAFDLQDTGDQAFCKAVADQLLLLNNNDEENDKLLLKILKGGFVAELALSFLHKQSKADRIILETCKSKLEERGSRSSVLHNAAVVTHAYLYAGTTNDSFLRDHLEWMKKASNWAKFTATASLGVVHASHVTEAMQLLEPYLPKLPTEGQSVSTTGGFAEGGSLYALGLIHGSHPAVEYDKKTQALEYLRQHLRASHANEVISHGAALAVGLTAMGSADPSIVQELKDVLDTDSAVAGEAAGIALGLVLVGSGAGNTTATYDTTTTTNSELSELVAELKNYARETNHEKIIRGIAMGLALMQFGQEELADAAIEELRSDRDPILRYGAQYMIALAYAGTGSSKAIRILLHSAVSDVSDDVRMAAVIGLAFVLFQTPERVPQLVQLLLESFNPHVRYASCMAVGIAMAGTGDSHSVALLEPMLEDMTDYVRQGALMGTAMIYMQQSDTANSRKIRSFREKLFTLLSEKHQSTLTKMGSILALGIIDAGGRNCALQLGSRNGFTKMSSTVGLALWLQHWHWYPMTHMMSLALTPTLTIGLNEDLKYPKGFQIVCNAKPSAFAYPKKLEEKKEKEKKRVETVTLSITAKEKARQARKKAKMGEGGADMEVDEPAKADGKKTDDDDPEAMEVEKEEEEEPKKKKREPEPTSFTVGNPSRITKAQSLVCEFDLTLRYRPVRPDEKPFGVIVLTDSKPAEADDDLGAVKPPSLEPEGELPPPEPFEWMPPPLPTQMEEAPKDDDDDAKEMETASE